MPGHQYRWLAGGYDLEIGHFLEVASMVVTWWIVAFLPSVGRCDGSTFLNLVYQHILYTFLKLIFQFLFAELFHKDCFLFIRMYAQKNFIYFDEEVEILMKH